MNGIESIKAELKEQVINALGTNLVSIICVGSFAVGDLKKSWSDVDLLLVVDSLNLEFKKTISRLKNDLENKNGVDFGINVIKMNEFLHPKNPSFSLDGKTLQALHESSIYKERILYLREGVDQKTIYSPNRDEIREYSLSNIMMFLLRNRKSLTSFDIQKSGKEILKKEIRACNTVIKLAVQYMEPLVHFDHDFIMERAKVIFPNYDFNVFDLHKSVVEKWDDLVVGDNLNLVLEKTDYFIESFTSHFNAMVSKNYK